MASAIVASAAASATSPTAPTATVPERNGDDDLDHHDSAAIEGAASSGEVLSSSSNALDGGNPNKIDRELISTSLVDGDNRNHFHGKQRLLQSSQIMKPLSDKVRSDKVIEVGNVETNPCLPATTADCGIPGRTVETSAKGFGEGPLPRELRRIIMEVAKTGKCSWLSWNQETTTRAAERDGYLAAETPSSGACFGSRNLPGAASKVSPTKAASSSPSSSQYASSLTNASVTGGGIVRKHTSFSGGAAAARRSAGHPPHKRHRNGVIHKSGERMRFGNPDGAFARSGSSSSSRKRPLVLVRANSNNAGAGNTNLSSNTNSNTMGGLGNNLYNTNAPGGTLSTSTTLSGVFSSAPSSVGSGRSTGSEHDYDSAQYECDSEGTSASTNSEISLRRTTRAKRSGAANTQGAQINSGVDIWTDTATMGDGEDENNSVDENNAIPGSPYKTLQTAFRGALGLVLDHFYQNRDNGYKLSPAEKRRNERFAETVYSNSSNSNGGDSAMNSDKLASLFSSEYVFQQRRQRLMAMLLPSTPHSGHESITDEPPFTIQRIAEVLIAPDRYYTQTHKLCNCLEKLLLVNSSTDSFGGSAGGDTSQRRREERELAALADEKGRQEFKMRQRRLAANRKASMEEWLLDDQADAFSSSRSSSEHASAAREVSSSMQNVMYEAKQASLAEKNGTDNTGRTIETNNTETMPSNAHRRANTTPSASSTSQVMLEALDRASLQTKFDNVGIESQQNPPINKNDRDLRTITENRAMTNSPPLSGPNMASNANISMPNHRNVNGFVRQHLSEQERENPDHHTIARVGSPILFPASNEPHLETTSTNMHMLQLHHAVALAGATLNRSSNLPTLDNLMTIDANTISQMRSQANVAGAGPGSESTDGRSSASNSDIDSESDDISFDDSASDRSDGSDSGSSSAHYEPFTAARAMALNRMQQQQRLQSRVLTSLGTSFQGEGYRPPADSEYQSGDSIDSTRAEDSGGSDSSSSDMAD
eukprot:CAMPEP_0172371818 /NCGR_PEP_ID=MMETSP1060-20121228/44980_1 /TAXON_ID=37318 /ORGANISM="Pseudo-nitzschia pungens, Strain cf. cingulata" /LENGTH=992 /DNA_ID=CAMNT_0013097569 /DNA_START=276 /DNA_END=3254 /DNA_ORIENTATION=+